MLIKYFIKSASFFLKSQFRHKKYDVIFSYDYKLKSAQFRNPYLLNPLLDHCKQHGLSYLILEDVDLRGLKPNKALSPSSIPMTAITIVEFLLKKIYLLFQNQNNLKKDIPAGLSYEDGSAFEVKRGKNAKRIARFTKLFFRKISCSYVITLVSNRTYLWRECFPEAKICDYQHGVIFDGEVNYLSNGKPPDYRISEKITTLVYSKKIKDILINNDNLNFYNDENLIVLGRQQNKQKFNLKAHDGLRLLFSCQNASDGRPEDLEYYYSMLINFFNLAEEFIREQKIQIILRNHPRSSNGNNPLNKFSYVMCSDTENIFEDMQACDIHITMNSSSVFEASELGIPTIFIELNNTSVYFPFLASRKLYLEQFNYPYSDFFVSSLSDFKKAINFYLTSGSSFFRVNLNEWHNMMINDISKENLNLLFNTNSKLK